MLTCGKSSHKHRLLFWFPSLTFSYFTHYILKHTIALDIFVPAILGDCWVVLWTTYWSFSKCDISRGWIRSSSLALLLLLAVAWGFSWMIDVRAVSSNLIILSMSRLPNTVVLSRAVTNLYRAVTQGIRVIWDTAKILSASDGNIVPGGFYWRRNIIRRQVSAMPRSTYWSVVYDRLMSWLAWFTSISGASIGAKIWIVCAPDGKLQ